MTAYCGLTRVDPKIVGLSEVRVEDHELRHPNCQLSVEPPDTKKSGLLSVSFDVLR